jgi:UDP:flavonoid glycosyltransferase YjiC (YdhE family)
VRVLQTLLAFSGNAPAQLGVTYELVRRGHEVRVLAHRAARERIERTGAEFVPFERTLPDLDISRPETDPVRDWEARTAIGAAARLRDRGIVGPMPDMAGECAELLAAWPADVLVFDWLFIGAAVAAEAAGVPSVALIHCPYPLPVEGAPPLFSGLAPKAGRLGELRDAAFNGLTRRFSAKGLPVLNRVRADHGLKRLERWEDQLLGVDEILVLTAPELDFSSRGALPANVHYVGPAFEPFDPEWSSPWPPENEDPLVVVSVSTSYMDQKALVQRVLDAVAPLPVRALLTAGPAIDPGELRLPSNARAASFVPHRAVFPHASLVVTHAGWQTVNAALADGVPVVCIPDGRDQPDNAARVVDAGAGVRVKKTAAPGKLRQVIAGALADPGLTSGAEKMAEALARSEGAAATADRLERLTAGASTQADAAPRAAAS